MMAGTPAVEAPLLMSSSEMFCHPLRRDTCVAVGGWWLVVDEQLGDVLPPAQEGHLGDG